ncbi:MAG: VCBS repeat-containing protein [Planctomycetes bacterium]|nr:VCBS repeat-containing protein [Planctomycetota bacterium]
MLAITPFFALQTIAGGFDSIFQWHSQAPGDLFAHAVADAGDVNGDGFPDILISEPSAEYQGLTDAGVVYVYSGKNGSLLHLLAGNSDGAAFGASVAGAGDLNGDGFADIVVGATHSNWGAILVAGTVFAYSGKDATLLHEWHGSTPYEYFGNSVSGVGDLNGDGYTDVMIGSRSADPGGLNSAGSAFVYSGSTGAILYEWSGESADALFGWQVASAGDLTGDGIPDLIVSAPYANPNNRHNAGSIYLYSGSDGSLLQRLDGLSKNDRIGQSISTAGDLNADGYDDIIFGAPTIHSLPGGILEAGAACAYSYQDQAILFEWHAENAFDDFGHAVAAAGDVDGDGLADVAVSALYADPNNLIDAGSVYLYSGADGQLIYQINGGTPYQQIGHSITGISDINQNGYDDVLVGASGYTFHNSDYRSAGLAFIFGFHPFFVAVNKKKRLTPIRDEARESVIQILTS